MDYARTITLDVPCDQAVPEVKEAFAAQGFGTLTEIDVRATLRRKLGLETQPSIILGTCNPEFARRALETEPEIGLLLPCNVVVRTHGGRTLVQAMDPQVMVSVPERDGLRPVAEEAGRSPGGPGRLNRVLAEGRNADAPAGHVPLPGWIRRCIRHRFPVSGCREPGSGADLPVTARPGARRIHRSGRPPSGSRRPRSCCSAAPRRPSASPSTA
ncbi:DUF302 domain-containing protein [Thermobifida halotolerans]|uniref:DUF302 domain-containing protein n=1 Tax=Thermobifida halotolerans TaxID=483545 RepID=A0AA97LZR0_9ACTN|nr:DUF302 domain-containing protein [Thermobifida halotolerans]UOE20964.1 DUF302 domain-containing protein [Thermobifida halotolerans]